MALVVREGEDTSHIIIICGLFFLREVAYDMAARGISDALKVWLLGILWIP